MHIKNFMKMELINDERIQYDSIESAKEAFAETYSFNIESDLYPQLNESQQKFLTTIRN